MRQDKAVITEEVGDIFKSPRNSILIHACNTQGVWGTGVALAFKNRYPEAFKVYNEHCKRKPYLVDDKPRMVGTALLITSNTPDRHGIKSSRLWRDRFHIGCLFTSTGYGKNVDDPEDILKNTAKALKDLADRISVERDLGLDLGDCRAVRINSGKFGVPWKKTKRVLEGGPLDIVVVRPKGKHELPEEDESEENGDGNAIEEEHPNEIAQDRDEARGHAEEEGSKKRELPHIGKDNAPRKKVTFARTDIQQPSQILAEKLDGTKRGRPSKCGTKRKFANDTDDGNKRLFPAGKAKKTKTGTWIL